MKKLIALTLTCLMLAALFTGCGDKSGNGGDTGNAGGDDVIRLGWMG